MKLRVATCGGALVLGWLVGCASPGPGIIDNPAPPGETDETVNHDLTDGEPLSRGDRVDLGQSDLTLELPSIGDELSLDFGGHVALPGDLDGDGYGELVIARTRQTSSGTQALVHVFWGGPDFGTSMPPSSTLEGWYGGLDGDNGGVGLVTLSGAGDIDGDGRADLLVGVASGGVSAGGPGTVVLMYGGDRWEGARELRTAGPVLRDDTYGSEFGRTLAAIGDTDGDGFDDFAIGAPSFTQAGALYVFHGASARLEGRVSAQASASYVLRTASRDAGFGYAQPAGDVNGDSLADFLAFGFYGSRPTDHIYLVLGSAARPSGARNVEGADARLDLAGTGFATTVGDLDGDGLDEIAFARATYGGGDTSHVLYGRRDWPAELDVAEQAELVVPPSAGEGDGGCMSMGRAGDFDGDGHADILCFDPAYHTGAVIVGLGVEGGLHGTVDLAAEGVTLLVRRGSGVGNQTYYPFQELTAAVTGGSDLDGDGRDDLAIGFPGIAVHVMLGRRTE